MGLPHDKSYRKSPEAKERMDKSPPTFGQFISEVAGKRITKMERGLIALGLMTSARISELIACKAQDILLYDHNDKEIHIGKDDQKASAGSYYKGVTPSDIKYAIITLKNQKNPRIKFKSIPVINVDDFEILFKWLLERLQELPDPLYEDKIYGLGRREAWWMLKYINKDYSPHTIRHLGTSNDVRNNLNVGVIQKKNGWSDLKQLDRYTHLSSESMLKSMIEVYKKKEEPKPESIKELDPIKEVAPKPAKIPFALIPVKQRTRRPNKVTVIPQKEIDNMLVAVV
jgi:integrase